MKTLFLLALLAGTAVAGTTTTEAPAAFDLLDAANKAVSPQPKTLIECITRAKAIGTWQCVTRQKFTTVANCDDVSKPVIPRVLDVDGYVIQPPMRGKPITENDWTSEVQDYVPAPAPICWVLGWREVTQADLVLDSNDLLVQEPVVWPDELQALWDASAAYHTIP